MGQEPRAGTRNGGREQRSQSRRGHQPRRHDDEGVCVATHDQSTGPLIDGLLSQVPDIDPEETSEWVESLDGLIDDKGGPRARYILLNLLRRARERSVSVPSSLTTPYVNTIGVHDEPYFPGDEAVERRFRSWIRWNAAGAAPRDLGRRAHLLVRVRRDALRGRAQPLLPRQGPPRRR